ncbi:MAG: hypothetical protein HY093_02475 [Candidatus Liptonbacteria bacterium]|nr:hypothetical protein [Candidatus Liptonbacteria bacterium]
MKSSFRFFISVFLGLFLAIVAADIFFSVNKIQRIFTFHPTLKFLLAISIIPSSTIVFSIIFYLLLPNEK